MFAISRKHRVLRESMAIIGLNLVLMAFLSACSTKPPAIPTTSDIGFRKTSGEILTPEGDTQSAIEDAILPTETSQPTENNSATATPINIIEVTETPDIAEGNAPAGGGVGIEPVYFQSTEPSAILSITDSHHSPPGDAILELWTGGMGAGPGDLVDINISNCHLKDEYKQPSFALNSTIEDEFEWHEEVVLDVCGWQPGEEIYFTVISPEGDVFEETVFRIDNEYGILMFEYFFDVNTSEGEYTFVLEGQSGKVGRRVFVKAPNKTRLFVENEKVFLYNFQSYEKVQLFAYRHGDNVDEHFILDGWDEFQVDGNGQLVIGIMPYTGGKYECIALGNSTGVLGVHYTSLNEEISGITLPYKDMEFRTPSEDDLKSLPSLLNVVPFRDLKEPGTQVYTLTVKPTDIWLWQFSWCAIDEDTLEQNVLAMGISFSVNEAFVYIEGSGTLRKWRPLLSYRSRTSSNWVCKKWATVLSKWPEGESFELEIRYNLRDFWFEQRDVFNGVDAYPVGVYRQIVNINVEAP